MTTNRPLGRLPKYLSAAVGLGAVGALALVVLVGGRAAAPSVTPYPSTGTGSAMCVEPYAGPASIAKRTLALDGTVTEIAGDKVTFTVNKAFRGAADASITLDAAGMTGTAITSAGGPNYEGEDPLPPLEPGRYEVRAEADGHGCVATASFVVRV